MMPLGHVELQAHGLGQAAAFQACIWGPTLNMSRRELLARTLRAICASMVPARYPMRVKSPRVISMPRLWIISCLKDPSALAWIRSIRFSSN